MRQFASITEGMVFLAELQAHEQGFHQITEKIPPRITLPSHGREIHLRNGYSARNCQLMDKESTGGMGFRRE
jgi:hypothetical protein